MRGGRDARQLMQVHRRVAVVVACATALIAIVALPGVAFAGGQASLNIGTAAPGQPVTVTASDFQPGSKASIDFLYDGVHMADPVVNASGGFVASVTIPPDTLNGDRQIVVTGVGADGTYAYLPLPVTVRGSSASASLSTRNLTPNARVTVRGIRFQSGSDAFLTLLPEGVRLPGPKVDTDRTFSITVTIPSEVINGKHQIVVTGAGADGRYAYVPLDATMTGGTDLGVVPGLGVGGTVPPVSLLPTTTVASGVSTIPGSDAFSPLPKSSDGGSTTPIAIALLVLLAALLLGAAWTRWTAGGREWIATRRLAHEERVQERANREPRSFWRRRPR